MKRLFYFAFCALLPVVSFSGCSKDDDGDDDKKSPNSEVVDVVDSSTSSFGFSIYSGSEVEVIGLTKDEYSLVIPAKVKDKGKVYDVTRIGQEAFEDNEGIRIVTLPNSIKTIGATAFLGCSNMTSINIPSSVTWIEDGAFADCIGLTTITIPSSVKRIGMSAFSGCERLDVVIDNKPENIEFFKYDEELGSVKATYETTDAFDGCLSVKFTK